MLTMDRNVRNTGLSQINNSPKNPSVLEARGCDSLRFTLQQQIVNYYTSPTYAPLELADGSIIPQFTPNCLAFDMKSPVSATVKHIR